MEMNSDGSKKKKLISIIIPTYNEEDNVAQAYNALLGLKQSLEKIYDFEFLFTDNHSSDKTFGILSQLAEKESRLKVLRFSRNFGYQRSIYTGYVNAKGDAAVQLDCDLQDPPEMIPEFLRLWESGYQVVYGIRRSRKENWLINTVRKIFYYLIDLLSEDSLPRHAGDFRLVDRQVLDELRKINDQQPYLRGAIATMGFNQIGVPYDRAKRLRGKSKFSFSELVHLGIDGILNHSIIPLRIASYIGITVSLLTLLGSICYIIARFVFGKDWPAGFATTTVLILASISLNALFLGIIGEYLGRIYRQVKKRPITIIEKAINTRGEIYMGHEN
jgi:dolichol-phosphate mannosyltransferase